MHIRRFRSIDEPGIERLYSGEQAYDQLSMRASRGWVALKGERLIAHAYTIPYPGLAGMEQLCLFVAPDERRAGVGSALLQRLLAAAEQDGIQRLSHRVDSLEGEMARFLQHHNFYMEHEEWTMELTLAQQLPPARLPDNCLIKTLPRQQAITTFRRLYDESFRATPWYQPYSYDEVEWELAEPEELLFLMCDGSEAGFIWLHDRGSRGFEIEPVGILAAYRGRGLGRALLLTALESVAMQQVERIRLTVWRENEAAVRLYEGLGFETVEARYYLAFDVAE